MQIHIVEKEVVFQYVMDHLEESENIVHPATITHMEGICQNQGDLDMREHS
jgi:hypothetical protein